MPKLPARPTDSASYVCPHVLDRTRPILLVIRECDGDWIAACGGEDQEQSTASWFVVGWDQVFERDPAVGGIEGLERGEAGQSELTARG